MGRDFEVNGSELRTAGNETPVIGRAAQVLDRRGGLPRCLGMRGRGRRLLHRLALKGGADAVGGAKALVPAGRSAEDPNPVLEAHGVTFFDDWHTVDVCGRRLDLSFSGWIVLRALVESWPDVATKGQIADALALRPVADREAQARNYVSLLRGELRRHGLDGLVERVLFVGYYAKLDGAGRDRLAGPASNGKMPPA
jgi:DNA-binding response OmpR family regulator